MHAQKALETAAAERLAISLQRVAIVVANSQIDGKRQSADRKAGILNAGAD